MQVFLFLFGFAILIIILVDALETVVLPRRVGGRFRLTGMLYQSIWYIWSSIAVRMRPTRSRENFLAFFGPFALTLLLVLWEVGLIFGFGFMLTGLTYYENGANKFAALETNVFTSAATILSVGLNRPTPPTVVERLLLVGEGGLGLAFLALVIGYLPSVYNAFADREIRITMMDARAGSPPTAYEVFRRCGEADQCDSVVVYLNDWEYWAADLLETHLSYPVLGFYRSQHENQSWLAALAVILDTSALVSAGIEGISKRQGKLTFAMARHALVDLAQVYSVPPQEPGNDRLSKEEFIQMERELEGQGIRFQLDADVYQHLMKIRQLYEPYLFALAERLLMPVPGWMPIEGSRDNWVSTAWGGSGQVRL